MTDSKQADSEMTGEELAALREAVAKGSRALLESQALGRFANSLRNPNRKHAGHFEHLAGIIDRMKDERAEAAAKAKRYAKALRLLEAA